MTFPDAPAGIDYALLSVFAERIRQGQLDSRLEGSLAPPGPGDIDELPSPQSPIYRELEARGGEALALGQCAFVVLAGGMATRMGGAVKALVEVSPGETFLSRRIEERLQIGRRFGTLPPLWFMTSHATDAPIVDALARFPGTDGVATFRQGVSVRLTRRGEYVVDADGRPSLYGTGHGDVVEHLQASRLLESFVAGGGKTVFIANLDNLGATLDPVILGAHLARSSALTSEVVERDPTDPGGLPLRVDGRLRAVEGFRLPPEFDVSQVAVFNINSFWFDAPELLRLQVPLSYFPVQKQVGDEVVFQFERILNEVTSDVPCHFLRVPRQGAASRFVPVKTFEDLARRQQVAAGEHSSPD